MNRTLVKHADWLREGAERFGDDERAWRFVCPLCGHAQSVASVLEHNPSLDPEQVERWIYFNCEGRTNPGHGCDWTLGGLFRIHTAEVEFAGEDGELRRTPVFAFAEPAPDQPAPSEGGA